MDDQRFEQLLEAARKYAHVKPDILNFRSNARSQLRQTLALLELESTPEQWAKVLEAIEADWP